MWYGCWLVLGVVKIGYGMAFSRVGVGFNFSGGSFTIVLKCLGWKDVCSGSVSMIVGCGW